MLAALPDQHRLMVETAIETGMRWGELIALKPRHLDFLRKDAHRRGDHHGGLQASTPPPANGMLAKPYPKDNEPRTLGVQPGLARRSRRTHQYPTSSAATTCCSPPARAPRSRATPSAPAIWQPAVKASGVGFNVRIHDLRHAHASWLLAGGSDLNSVMDRMGHAQIQTTQKYLHAPADADQKNLSALDRIRNPALAPPPRPGE